MVVISVRQQWAVAWNEILIPAQELNLGSLDENQESNQQGIEARS